jgi:hypothetical protein
LEAAAEVQAASNAKALTTASLLFQQRAPLRSVHDLHSLLLECLATAEAHLPAMQSEDTEHVSKLQGAEQVVLIVSNCCETGDSVASGPVVQVGAYNMPSASPLPVTAELRSSRRERCTACSTARIACFQSHLTLRRLVRA